MEWETVIGLEIHVQLATQSKLFSGAATQYGAEQNTQACEIDLAMPGALPVLNKDAVEMAVKFGLSIGAEINMKSVFARKNYFYPDLPKGYQISQFELPIVGKGEIKITLEDGQQKTFGITRAHLEEDAGKSLHNVIPNHSGIDLNRAGTPLIEIVSEPDFRSAKEAVAYLKTIHSLVRYLDISDANMQEGSFRCDVNVSVRPKGETKLGTRTETKNVNSFKFVEKAIYYEVERQINLLEDGGTVRQETRLYNPDQNNTRAMRSKEEAMDYRYFPDPDLLPVELTEELINQIKTTLPELPWQKSQRFQQDYKLSEYDANVLTASKSLADYYEHCVSTNNIDPKLTANWVTGELLAALNKNNLTIKQSPVTSEQLSQLLLRITDNTISGKIAKTVFETMWAEQSSADEIIEKQGLKQITDESAIIKIIDQVLADNPTQLEQYRSGKDKLFGFFVGKVMAATKGKANPAQVNQLLKAKLAPA